MKKIGFIGQGFIGKAYADDFAARGHTVVRYAAEPQFVGNKEKIKDCDIVFIAVPTPTTPEGFSDRIIREVIKLVGKGKIAVIKSTMIPGTTISIQKENPDIFVLHSPEFLNSATAGYDAAHPIRNIIGIPQDDEAYKAKAKEVLDILPKASYSVTVSSTEAELIKYARNCVGYFRVIFYNLLYDVATKEGADWNHIREAISADPENGPQYTSPVHKTGRGAGGPCFIKDFAAFRKIYEDTIDDPLGREILKNIEAKNIELLKKSNKDLELLKGVYGSTI